MKDWRIVVALMLCGTVLTIARRWHNDDPTAGAGVAGWTMAAVFFYVTMK